MVWCFHIKNRRFISFCTCVKFSCLLLTKSFFYILVSFMYNNFFFSHCDISFILKVNCTSSQTYFVKHFHIDIPSHCFSNFFPSIPIVDLRPVIYCLYIINLFLIDTVEALQVFSEFLSLEIFHKKKTNRKYHFSCKRRHCF